MRYGGRDRPKMSGSWPAGGQVQKNTHRGPRNGVRRMVGTAFISAHYVCVVVTDDDIGLGSSARYSCGTPSRQHQVAKYPYVEKGRRG